MIARSLAAATLLLGALALAACQAVDPVTGLPLPGGGHDTPSPAPSVAPSWPVDVPPRPDDCDPGYTTREVVSGPISWACVGKTGFVPASEAEWQQHCAALPTSAFCVPASWPYEASIEMLREGDVPLAWDQPGSTQPSPAVG